MEVALTGEDLAILAPPPTSHSDGRHRDIFPLPVGALCETSNVKFPVSCTLSRATRRRALARGHAQSLARDAAVTLNEMCLGRPTTRVEDLVEPSAIQREIFDDLMTSATRFGKPPDDMSSRGAFNELQASRSYGGESATIASLNLGNVDKVSLPCAGFMPAPISQIGNGLGRKLIETMDTLEYPRAEGLARAREFGPRRPYTDPGLRSPQLYAALLKRLRAANLVDFYSSCVTSVGIVFVFKKDGTLRLILDGRVASEMFKPAPKVKLATGGSFAYVEVDSHNPIWISGVDISNAFYALQLPPYYRRFFGMPPIRADLVGVTVTAEGRPVAGHQKVIQCFCAPPHGVQSLSVALPGMQR